MSTTQGWSTGRLGELCSIEIGGTPSRDVPDYWDESKESGNHWVSIKDLNTRVITNTAEQITEAGIKHSNVKYQEIGAILLSFKLTIGRVAFAGVPLYTNEAIAALCSNELDHDFLIQGLQQWDLLQGVDQAIKGATLNKEKLRKIEFEYPSAKSEQTKIAEVLSTVDRAIEQTEALIAKQQRIKTGLMQDLLTRGVDEHGNLRSEATHEFKDSPLGRIPVEWEVKSIDEIAQYVGSGVTPRGGASVYATEGVLFIRSQNVFFYGLRLSNVAYITERTHLGMLRSEVFINDILLNITGASIGRCCQMPFVNYPANVNQHVCIVRLNNVTIYKANLLAAVLESSIGQNQIAQFNAGGNREGLNYQQVRSFLIPWPCDTEEFKRIYEHVQCMAKIATNYKDVLIKLRSLKKSLMQGLLTGKKRVTPLLEPETNQPSKVI